MRIVTTLAELRNAVGAWKLSGQRIGFVPTMGNLHAGHLSLIARACELSDRVVASIFVNPLQFGPGEDLAAYPHTPDEDRRALAGAGCDLLYMPDVTEMYPRGHGATLINVGELGVQLCGAHREGHFDGMATVVVKLLNQVAPDLAVFGQKDYQQLIVIRRAVRDLDIAVKIHGVPTVREDDGLAMSSRNGYLNETERRAAPRLYCSLRAVADALIHGDRDFDALAASASAQLVDAGFRPDYVAVRAPDLSAPHAQLGRYVVLAAAWLGGARLIDNVVVEVAG